MTTRKPFIGITADYRAGRKDAGELTWISSGYYDCVTAAGGIPVVIPPLTSDEDLEEFLSHLDGVLLSGSMMDMDPVRLGMETHPTTRPLPARREDFDRRLAKMAVEKRVPILAIGLGMQLLNVVCGGNLTQHVAEDIPNALQHRDPVETYLRHIIDIVPGTRVDQIYGPGEIRVNSQHHMAVNTVASLFRVSATAPDGIVEAYESIEESWCCIGVQWHPENETASALDMQIFQFFLEQCEASEAQVYSIHNKVA